MSKGLEALEKVIEDISLEWGYEGIEDELREKLKPLYEDLERLEKLGKAFDKACERLDWGCPEEQNLIDDFIDYFDCENCKNTEKECWKKYFLKEVLE